MEYLIGYLIRTPTYHGNSEVFARVHNYMRGQRARFVTWARFLYETFVLRVLSQIRNWYTYKLADVHSLNTITTRQQQRHHAGQVDACSPFFMSNDFNGINRFCGLAQVHKQRPTDVN